MSVSNTASTASFTLNQTTSTFTFTFRALTSSPEDIKCIVTTNSTNQNLAYSTDYTVAVDSDGVGGVVTLVSPSTISKGTLTVYRATTNTQESDYDDYNQFPANTLETDLDRRTLVSQEQAEALTRTLLLPITVTGVSAELPNPVANKVLGWNSAGTAIENKDELNASYVTSCQTAQSLAQAAATSATTSANSIINGNLNVNIDGGGVAISTGKKGKVEIPFACTLTGYTMIANTQGSIAIDINKSTYANYPSTSSICLTVCTIINAWKSTDLTLTGWTKSTTANDILEFEVDSCSSISNINLSLRFTRA